MQYEVVDDKGNKFDMSVCDDLTISIGQPIDIPEDLLKEAEGLNIQFNIESFDPNSLFYNDVCVKILI